MTAPVMAYEQKAKQTIFIGTEGTKTTFASAFFVTMNLSTLASEKHQVLMPVKMGIRRMTETIIAPARLCSTDFVMDAGCDVWSTAIYLARTYGCRVLGININQHQINIANGKIANSALRSFNLNTEIAPEFFQLKIVQLMS